VTPRLLSYLLCATLLALAACDPTSKPSTAQQLDPAAVKGKEGKTASGRKVAGSSDEVIYPVSRAERKYQKVNPSVTRAWFLTESAHFILKDKLQKADKLIASSNAAEQQQGIQQKSELTQRIQQDLFRVNPEIDALFQEAMKAEPDNPLNMVSYAEYLKPRRNYVSKENDEQLPRALELYDEAIKLWPDESSFYMIKVHALTSPQMVFEYTRSTYQEESVIAGQFDYVQELLAKAEHYDPNNWQINYTRALLTARFAPKDGSPETTQAILREIRAGNKKLMGAFAFPPPLPPYNQVRELPKLTATATTPVYFDQWAQYGFNDIFSLDKMQYLLGKDLHWPKDRDEIGDVMFMYYLMGRTKPFEHTYFSWQQGFLQALRDQPSLTRRTKRN
jgi:hypothetical protein